MTTVISRTESSSRKKGQNQIFRPVSKIHIYIYRYKLRQPKITFIRSAYIVYFLKSCLRFQGRMVKNANRISIGTTGKGQGTICSTPSFVLTYFSPQIPVPTSSASSSVPSLYLTFHLPFLEPPKNTFTIT